MKITCLRTAVVSLPLGAPMPSALLGIASISFALCFLNTGQPGPVATGLAHRLDGRRTRPMSFPVART